MKATIDIVVMTCPPREERAGALLRVLDMQAAGSNTPTPKLVVDRAMRGSRAAAADAWAHAHDTDATHLLVLQDDVFICRHFVDCAINACSARPDDVLSFCALGPVPTFDGPFVWRGRRALAGAQAIAMPTKLAREASVWLRTSAAEHDDQALSTFLRARGKPVLLATPSLVEHDTSVPSLLRHDECDLRTHVVVDPEIDPRFLPWRGAPVLHEVM